MKYYISPSGEFYAYELDGSQDHLIPSNFVAATPAQVQAHENPPIDERSLVIGKITELEAEKLMPRPIRELMLVFAENNNLTDSPSYTSLKNLDDQIKSLRSQL